MSKSTSLLHDGDDDGDAVGATDSEGASECMSVGAELVVGADDILGACVLSTHENEPASSRT